MRVAVMLAIAAGCGFAPASLSGGPAASSDANARQADADAAAAADRCPGDFVAVANAPATSVYKLYNYSIDTNAQQPFDTSVATCSAQGAHLVIVDTAAEANALAAVIVPDPSFPFYAVGLTDAAVEGTWLTVLGTTPDYLPWEPGQPDGAGGGDGDCGILDLAGALYDYYCDDAHPYAFACECEL